MDKLTSYRCKQHQAGFATTEMVIVLPLLLLLLLGTAEFGRVLYQYEALTKSIRDAARYGSSHALTAELGYIDTTHPEWTAVQQDIKNLVVCGMKSCVGQTALLDNLAVTDVSVTAPDGEHLRVDATYYFEPIFGNTLSLFGLGGSIALNFPLRSSITLRAL